VPKIAPIRRAYNVVADNASFVCCCVRNVRNPEKFTENLNLWSSRSSRVIDLGVNGKPICDFILVINSNFTVYTVFEIFTVKDRKLLISPTPSLFDAPSGGTPWDIDVIYTPLKRAFNALQFRPWHYRSIFIRLAVVASQSRQIARNSDKIRVLGLPTRWWRNLAFFVVLTQYRRVTDRQTDRQTRWFAYYPR